MLPGYVAGDHRYDEAHIDLEGLARFAGAAFIRDEVVGIERGRKRVLCLGRGPLDYDLLAINTGSAPRMAETPGAGEHAVGVKPIDGFAARWEAILDRVRARDVVRSIAVVGGGAAGVEVVLAVQHRLRAELGAGGRDPHGLALHLVSSGPTILATHNAPVRSALLRILAERGVSVHLNAEVTSVSAAGVWTARGSFIDANEVIWATRAQGAPWLRNTGLDLDEGGFVRVDHTLQTLTDPRIFASGDVASLSDVLVEKAGVFAVRQGPVLAGNLRRAIEGRPLRRYRPQRSWLAIIGTGDHYAVASRGRLKAEGRWVWRLKRWIDARFMARFAGLDSENLSGTRQTRGTPSP
jgi:selenide,water dikinase